MKDGTRPQGVIGRGPSREAGCARGRASAAPTSVSTLLVVVLLVLLAPLVLTGGTALAGDCPRVRIAGNTVVTALGDPLRGGTCWVFEHGRATGSTAYTHDPAYWKAMRAAGLNACRLVFFDPWQRAEKYVAADLDDAADVAALVADMDRIVDLATAHKMYVLINFHDVGRYDLEYAVKFWTIVAPRYAERTHVLFELLNEPVSWYPEHYDARHIADQQTLHTLVRGHAPDTHVALLSFANTTGFDPKVTMLDVASRLRGIDWTKASVAFHPYNTRGHRSAGSSADIVLLKRSFPVLDTEQGLPHHEGTVPMDGELWGIQTMERLRIGWFGWQMEGFDKLRKNHVLRALAHARENGYMWDRRRAGCR